MNWNIIRVALSQNDTFVPSINQDLDSSRLLNKQAIQKIELEPNYWRLLEIVRGKNNKPEYTICDIYENKRTFTREEVAKDSALFRCVVRYYKGKAEEIGNYLL